MNRARARKAVLAAIVFAVATVAGSPAWADRGYNRFGGHHRYSGHDRHYWGLGLGLLAGTAVVLAATPSRPLVYSSPVYAPPVMVMSPPVVVSPPMSPTLQAYVEPTWWYYCTGPAGYYPYVKTCPSGWLRVSPTPPGQ